LGDYFVFDTYFYVTKYLEAYMLKRILISVFFILLFATPVSGAGPIGNGVDDLRGRWDVYLHIGDEYEGEDLEVRWLIQDIEAHPEDENTFLASGCMLTISTGGSSPLSLVATYLPEENYYELMVYSTVIPVEGEPFVIRFDGEVFVHGSGVKDDESQGDHISDRGEGPWEAEHHDRRRPHCGEMIDPSLQFNQDLYAHQDIAPPTPHYYKLYEAYTHIVSSGMLVDTPDGQTVYVPSYTDIFSPFVDFVSEFRFLLQLEGAPISGEIYTFTLLDILGNPIPGAIAEDIWTGCTQEAPGNIQLSYNVEESIHMTWDPVPITDGWDPGGEPQVGYYQIGISPIFESQTSYGSAGIASPEHIIPWESFVEGENGDPDGTDFGLSLSELDDGVYDVNLEAFSEALPASGGFGAECSVRDSNELLQMNKSDDEFTFTRFGTIAGHVTNHSGDPLTNVWVDACEYSDEPQYCRSSQTDENGNYYINGMLPGDYRVQAGNESYAREFYDDSYQREDATPVSVSAGETTPGIDFELFQAGSISGRVFDESGVPLSNIAVDIEDGGFGACTNENGSYTMSGLPLGNYTVVAGRDFCGPHDYIEESIEDIELTDETPDVDGVDFYLTQGGSIAGTVSNSLGFPIEGIHVEACEFTDEPEFCRGAETDEAGNYLIPGLLSNDIGYRVWTGNETYAQEFFDGVYQWHLATAVLVTAGETTLEVDFDLSQAGSISGAVFDDSGDPLSHMAVDIEEGGFGVCTDEEGNYTLSGLPLGTYNVVAGRDFCDPDDYIEERIEGIELTEIAPDVGGVDFNLTQGGSISGTVTDSDGPLSGAHVEACEYSDDPLFCRGAETDEFGNYIISGLLPTTLLTNGYRVWAEKEGYIQELYNETNNWGEATAVPVEAGETTLNINFTLEEGGSIAGTVTEIDGDPLEGFQVVACKYLNGFCMDAFSDSEGNYTINGLPEGNYRVQSGSEWYVTEFFEETYDWGEAEPVPVIAGVTTPNINFTLEEGGSIAGMVVNDGGSPIEGVIVIACEYDGSYCMDATSASDGTYRIFAIPASDYRVEAHGEGYQIEFFSETVDPDSATRVPVAVNVITESIDFSLTPD
jgi:protocatechuate 3,4-dioxygenase beta subunit